MDNRLTLTAVSVCALAVLSSINSAHAVSYTIVDLGTLGGSYSSGYGINNSGQVVGESRTASGATVAFFYDGSRMLDLCLLSDCTSSGWSSFTAAYDINNNGDISGYGSIGGQTHTFLLTNVSAVPVPAAVWLFGSGLLGLVGVARRKKT